MSPLVGMEGNMKKESELTKAERPERRAFFGQLFATVGGGLLTGSLLHGLLKSHTGESRENRPVSITTNPLAVPRTKEGSKSNV
jgi:hypothetical protein